MLRSPALSAIEPLERRTLLAGVTILTHGYLGNITGWISSAADAIADRIGGNVPVYRMAIGATAGSARVASFEQTAGPAFNSTTHGEMIVMLDWTAVDDGKFSTAEVGTAAADYMVAGHGDLPALASLPMHLIGHSRGGSLVVAIAQRLGQRGVWVEHMTALDPHPVDGDDDFLGADFGDTRMRVVETVGFADNYWRTDGIVHNLEFDGEPVTGAHNVNLNGTVEQQNVGSAHMSVTGYYHGTIDDDARTNGDSFIFDSWYGNGAGKPGRDDTGYAFSKILGVSRPLDGLHPASGGTASRVAIAARGSQRSNVIDLYTIDRRETIGERIRIRFRRLDRDSAATVQFFLDTDQNPFNGVVRKIAQRNYGQTDDVVTARINALSNGVAPGKYFVLAKTSDTGGHYRYAVSRPITLVAPAARVGAANFIWPADTSDDETESEFDSTSA